MNRNWITTLIALSTLIAFGCTEEENSSQTACTHGTTQCVGTMPTMCVNGVWLHGKDCGLAGCNLTTGLCNPSSTPQPTACTHGTKQCVGTTPQVCINGTWVSTADCGSIGCNTATGLCNNPTPNPGNPNTPVNPSPECTHGETQCLGTMPQMCINDAWVNGTDCGAIGCNPTTGLCNTNDVPVEPNPDDPVAGGACDPTTYEGGCSTDGTKRYYCGNDGTLVEKLCTNGSSCVVKGNNSSKCEGGTDSGETCTKDTYTPSCSEDKLNGYYCSNQGTVVTISCPNANCVNNSGYIKCDDNSSGGETALCTPGGTVYCQKTCNADATEGYYYSQGEVHTVSCPNADCYISADNRVVCGTESGTTDPTPGDEPVAGASCDPNTYAGGCNADKSKRYYCGNDGKLVEKICDAGKECVVNGNNSSKCETVATPGDEPVAGASCDPNTYAGGCNSDKSKRYYCGNDGKLVEKICDAGKECVVKGNNSSKCETVSSGGEETVEDCAPGGTVYCQKVCNADKTEGYYYSKGEVHTVSCPNADCYISADNRVVCGTESGTTDPTPGDEPVAGASCDPNTYAGGCNADKSKRYYCGNDGKLVEKTCSAGQECVVNGNNSSKCETVSSGGEETVEDCAPGGTVYCQKVCNAAKTEGYYYSKGEVHTVSCPNADCYISADNRVVCGTESGTTDPTPGDEPVAGASCDPNTYAGGCNADKSKRYYCGNDGKLVEKTCSAGQECVVNGNNSSKCETVSSGGEETVEDCAPGGTVYCQKVCNAAKTEGYYYSKGEVHTVSCPNADCYISADNRVVCGTESGTTDPTPGDEPVAGASCDPNTYAGGCNADKSKRYYCGNDGKLVEKACSAGQECVVNGNNSSKCETVSSGGEETVEDCAPGGTVYCQKVCNAAKTEGYYYSKGEVHTVSCPNADCYISADNRVVCGTESGDVTKCGNGKLDEGEACDGSLLGGMNCSIVGFGYTGIVTCLEDCSGHDTSDCKAPPILQNCGNGVLDDDEHCDGDQIRGGIWYSCKAYFGPGSEGTISCKENCTGIVMDCTSPYTCGDGKQQINEKCDPLKEYTEQLTCAYTYSEDVEGSRSCNSLCRWNNSECLAPDHCGNGIIEPELGEECDPGSNQAIVKTCEEVYGEGSWGNITCNSLCRISSTGCFPSASCGNGILDNGLNGSQNFSEVCDGDNLNKKKCSNLGKGYSGTLKCLNNCSGFDFSDCTYTEPSESE